MSAANEKRRIRNAMGSLPPATAGQSTRIISLIAAELEAVAADRGATLGPAWVMAYFSLAPEPDLSGLWSAGTAAGWSLAAPAVDWSAGMMSAKAVADCTASVCARSPRPDVILLEPAADAAEVSTDDLDLVLVPGVAFDASGGRLGRGGGFYDRFLSRWRARRRSLEKPARAIGVCTADRVVAAVPREAHDERVDAIVTEFGLVRCSG